MPTPAKSPHRTDRGVERKTRVYILDDQAIVNWGTRKVIESASDLEFAGSNTVFSDDLSSLVQSRADVVIVDLKWGSDDDRGLDIIRTIRRELGARVGIIAYTGLPLSCNQSCIDAGADRFEQKATSIAPLVDAIRNCKDHAYISRLTLRLQTQQCAIEISRNGSVVLEKRVGNMWKPAFCLLWYLAEERARGESEWLIKLDGVKGAPYTFTKPLILRNIMKHSGNTALENGEVQVISSACSEVNREVATLFDLPNKVRMIIPPGTGRKMKDKFVSPDGPAILGMYCLNEFIASTEVVFYGERP